MKSSISSPLAPFEVIARNPHNLILALIISTLAAFYYYIASAAPAIFESYPWLRLFISFEFNHRLNGSLFYIPCLYAAIALGWQGTLAIWAICMAAIMPHLFDYSLDVGGLIINLALLSIPSLLALAINLELKWREKERNAAMERELERQHYIAQIFEAQEAERKRISQELHDDTIQTLVVMANSIQCVVMDEENKISPRTKIQLEKIQSMALKTTEELRRLCLDLRPSILDNLGLVPAVRWLLDQFNEGGPLCSKLILIGDEKKLPSNVEVLIFRFVQEALNNARQHAKATHVTVTLSFRPEAIEATVQDDGRGFKVPENIGSLASEGKLGLIGMQERARLVGGRCRIDSHIGQGTTVSLSVSATNETQLFPRIVAPASA